MGCLAAMTGSEHTGIFQELKLLKIFRPDVLEVILGVSMFSEQCLQYRQICSFCSSYRFTILLVYVARNNPIKFRSQCLNENLNSVKINRRPYVQRKNY